ncbi:HlyD family secretion protein [Azotosporobacter soli]|uniref:HlyD family secretion protein n=1 Tax=Azotosporobacter soli TaxID=3055040 RepID=UPI0031FEE4F2
MKLSPKLMKIIIVLLITAAAGGGYSYLHRGEISTDDAAIEGRNIVIMPKVQGYVKTLNINDNQMVKAGDVLLEIDPTDYLIKRDRALAALTAARAAADVTQNNLKTTVVAAPSNVDSAEAQVAAAEAVWKKSAADRQRMEQLFSTGACSRQQLDQAVASEQSDRASLDKVAANYRSANTAGSVVGAAQGSSAQAMAQVKQAEADLAQAESDLANTKIVAPIDGRITKRSVEAGNYVQIGQQLGSLVGTELWVTANFKETQLEQMRPGQTVDIVIDAYPDVKLQGKIDSFQAGTGARFSLFPAENATGNFVKTVQRVPIKITLDTLPDDGIHLGPGMSVIPTVHTAKAGRLL